MSFSVEHQLELFGPQIFEDLCCKLIVPSGDKSYQVEGNGGNHGISIFQGPRDPVERTRADEKLHVWQVKFFPDGLKSSQRRTIVYSLKRVMETLRPDAWTLCVPVNLSLKERDWFYSLRDTYADLDIHLLDGSSIFKLALLPKNASIIKSYFVGLGVEKALTEQLLTETCKRHPFNTVFLQMHAMLVKSDGRIDEARELFRKASEINPDHAHTWQAWAIMEKEQNVIGDRENPEKYTSRWLFRKGVKTDPENPYLRQAWAVMEGDERNIGDAEHPEEYTARWLFHEGLKVDPDNVTIWQAWAMLERAQKNIGDVSNPTEYTARWLFRKAAEVNPHHAHTWQAWAVMEKEQKNIGDMDNPAERTARWLFRKAVEADPQDAFGWQAWAVMEREQKNIGDRENPEKHTARWLFHEGVKADPHNAHLWQAWADVEKDLMNWSEAERLYVMAAESTDSLSDRSRIYFDLSFMILKLNREDEAIEYLKLAVEANPDDHIVRAKLGRAYSFKSMWQESEEQFLRSLEIEPNDSRTMQWYGTMLHHRDRYGGRSSMSDS